MPCVCPGAGTSRSSGLSNMRDRAERHGGTFSLSANQPRGTVLEWRVPLGDTSGPQVPRRRAEDGVVRLDPAPEELTPVPARRSGGAACPPPPATVADGL